MEVLKRKYKEIIALYTLETTLSDIYVEGNTDKLLIQYFLKSSKIYKNVLSIEHIDFEDIEYENFKEYNLRSNNKDKVLVLSVLLNQNIPNTIVRCIVDKDFDDYLSNNQLPFNNKLLKTDFSCMESYFFCMDVIEKFLSIGIGGFPHSSEILISELGPILRQLYCLRLFREMNYKSATLVKYEGNIQVDKKTGKINFDFDSYFDKFINRNGLSKKSKQIKTEFMQLFSTLDGEIKNAIHGHDFFEIMYLYVNKVKNTPKYKEDQFPNIIRLSTEAAHLMQYPLFQTIAS